MAKQIANQGRRWYAIHTYSGYEENVADNLNRRVDTMDMEDKIFNVLVPKEKKVRIKNGKRKTMEEKIFPGDVLLEMIATDAPWYVVRNTPNVTGSIGTGTTPTPVSQEEMDALLKRMRVDEPQTQIDIEKGSVVSISDGPFKNFEGKVADVDRERGQVKVLVNMFGRETPVELDFLQVKKV